MHKSLKDNLPKNISSEDKYYLSQYGDKLSDSTQYVQWISNPKNHEERLGKSLATRNHDVIRQWAEERKAVPATVSRTEHDNRPGTLRFNFPGYGGKNLKEISWDEWFKTFDERKLVFLFQEHLTNGNQSNFFRFDNPLREDA